MKGKIEHQGVIESVEGDHIRINIVQQAACSGCKARSMCTSSESKEKIIDVYEPGAMEKYSQGSEVTICAALSTGKTAAWLAFGVPVIIISVWMFVAIAALGIGELTATGILAGFMAVYFYVLYLNRGRMSKKIMFWIETGASGY